MNWINVIIPMLSSIIVGLISYAIHNKITTKKAHRIHRRQLTGLISEVDSGFFIMGEEKPKATSYHLPGMLLSYPMTAVLNIIFREIPYFKSISILMSQYDEETGKEAKNAA